MKHGIIIGIQTQKQRDIHAKNFTHPPVYIPQAKASGFDGKSVKNMGLQSLFTFFAEV